MSSSCGPINSINGKACKGLIGPPCKRLSYSNPEEFCRLKYEPCGASAGIKYLVFLLLEGEPVTLTAIFLFDPLYCNFIHSLQCTFPCRECVLLRTFTLTNHFSSPARPTKIEHTSKGVSIFFSSCVFKIWSGTF